MPAFDQIQVRPHVRIPPLSQASVPCGGRPVTKSRHHSVQANAVRNRRRPTAAAAATVAPMEGRLRREGSTWVGESRGYSVNIRKHDDAWYVWLMPGGGDEAIPATPREGASPMC